MNPKVSYTLVGAFVLLLGAAIVTAIVWLSSAGGDKTYDTYLTYMGESVSGLTVNARVSYNGVEIGRVSDIRLDHEDPSQVRIQLEIESGSPVKTDTVAKLASSGITGVAHVELSGGTAEAPRLEAAPGEEFPVIASQPSLFVRLDASITTLVEELTGAASSLTDVADRVELLLDEENRETIGDILANVETFTVEIQSIVADVKVFTGNVAEASEGLPRLMASAERVVARAEDTMVSFEAGALSIDNAGADVSAAAHALEASVEGVAEGVERMLSDLTPFTRGVPSRLVYLVDELNLLAATLRRFAQDIENNPDTLIFGRRDFVRGPGE